MPPSNVMVFYEGHNDELHSARGKAAPNLCRNRS